MGEHALELLAAAARILGNTYSKKILFTFFDLLIQLLPSLVTGILVSTILILYLPRERIGRLLYRKGGPAVVFSACLGALSPIGTYAVIPFVASLLRTASFPVAPLVAFLIASPLINPLLFFLTKAAFGMEMALMRLAASLILGILGGLAALYLWKDKSAGATAPVPETGRGRITLPAFRTELFKQSKFILRIFSLSLFIAAAVSALVPANLIMRVIGGDSSLSVILAVLLGIPLYACGGGSIPVMEVLHDMGMSKGAVLAFFISGPATKASTLAALLAAMERKVVLLYLGLTLLGAFAFGMTYNLF